MLFEDKSLEIIRETIRKERAEGEYEKETANEMLLDFYANNQLLPEYLSDYGFENGEGETDLPMMSVNLTAKIIDKISLAYKYPPERYISDSEGSEVSDWFAMNNHFSLGYKYAERYKNLLGKVLHKVDFDAAKKKWFSGVKTVYEAHFLAEGSGLYPYAYSYPYEMDTKSSTSANEVWWLFWSDEFVFSYIPGTDKVRYLDFAPTGDNPFKVMPMVEMRASFPVEQYECIGAFDLVRANQNVNIALNNLNTMIYFQAHDQIVIEGAQPQDVKRIRLGSADPLVSPGDVNFKLLGFNPKITESIEAIRFNIEAIGYVYNLKIGWSLDGNAASGFSLIVQNIDLSEAREDDIELMKIHETDMYRVLLAMQDYYRRFNMLDPKDPKLPDGDLVTDFEESLQLPINQDEEIQRKQFELDNNIITVVDLIQEANPDMDEKEAEEKYMRNKKLNGTLTSAEIIRSGLEAEGVAFESDGQQDNIL